MPSKYAYSAGMKKRRAIQYTIRQVPERVDMILREKAGHDHASINETALKCLSQGLGVAEEELVYHDLDDLAGSWVKDPAFDKALRDMDRIDPEIWK